MKQIKLDYIKHNIAPFAVKKIGVFNNQNKLVGTLNIKELKDKYSQRLYRFGVLSDVHQNTTETAAPGPDFENALTVFNNKESVAFTCICGDITQNTDDTRSFQELSKYNDYVKQCSPNTRVYTTKGNHDYNITDDNWLRYTGNNKTFKFDYNGDHFLFLGMETWSLGSSGTPYSDNDITLLREWLEEYKNDRCFVFTHLFFPTRAGNFKNVYPPGNWLGGSQLLALQELNNKYKNVYWFSGHSHWKWYLQKHQKNANIYGKNCGWNIHIPSCASPIDSVYRGNGDKDNYNNWTRTSVHDESEGAIIDVYEDYIEVRGISFKQSGNSNYELKYIPCAQYRLKPGDGDNDSYNDVDFSNIDYVKASEFTPNTLKVNNNSLSNMSVIDLGNNYVEVRFNNASQGFLIRPSSFIENPSKIYLQVEDVKYYTSPNNDTNNLTLLTDIPTLVGFYCVRGIYGIYSDLMVSTNDDGQDHIGRAPFQTSSSFITSNGQLNIGVEDNKNQLVIQMKVKLAYIK